MTKEVSASELAATLRVSGAAITKAVKRGRLSKSVKGKRGATQLFDLDIALREWRENNGRPDLSHVDQSAAVPLSKRSSPKKANRPPASSAAASLPVPADQQLEADPDQLLDTNGNPIMSSVRSRMIMDHYKAMQSRLEYEVTERKYAPIEEIGQLVEREYFAVRAKMLAVSRKMAPVVAPLDDPNEIATLIEDAINEALAELTADNGDLPAKLATPAA